MAISKILHINSNSRSPGHHLKIALEYIRNGEKTQELVMTGAINCQSEYAYEQMKATKSFYEKNNKRQAYHLIISFNEGEVDADTALKLISEFTEEYLGDRYEAVYAVHDNTNNIHGHIIWNSVSFKDGKKYRYSKGDWENIIQPMVNRYCEKYSLKTLDITTKRDNESREWDQNKDGPFVWSTLIKRDIDACIILSEDFAMFIQAMEDKGYEVKCGKYLAVKPKGMQRFRRCKTLGIDYAEESIKERIAHELIRSYKRNKMELSPRIISCNVRHIKKAKLTGLQKKYFAKLYRLGKLKKRPYSQAWKYKDDIKKMHKLTEQYLFLAKYNIKTEAQLHNVIKQIKDEKKLLSTEKRKLNRRNISFKDLFKIAEEMKKLQPLNNYYQQGDDAFEEEHIQFLERDKSLKESGYGLEEVLIIKEHYDIAMADNRAKFNELKKENITAESISKEIQVNRELERKDPEKIVDKKHERKR